MNTNLQLTANCQNKNCLTPGVHLIESQASLLTPRPSISNRNLLRAFAHNFLSLAHNEIGLDSPRYKERHHHAGAPYLDFLRCGVSTGST